MNGNIKPCNWKNSTPTICSKYAWAQQYNFGGIDNEVGFIGFANVEIQDLKASKKIESGEARLNTNKIVVPNKASWGNHRLCNKRKVGYS